MSFLDVEPIKRRPSRESAGLQWAAVKANSLLNRATPHTIFLALAVLSISTNAAAHGIGNGYPFGSPTFLPATILEDELLFCVYSEMTVMSLSII